MTSLVRKATLLTMCGVLVAGAAMAGIPSATNSIKSSPCLVLVGDNGTLAAPLVTAAIPDLWTIQVKDGVGPGNVVPFSVVRIDMTNCQSIHVATQPSQKGPYTMIVDPSIKSVTATADASGIARFVIEGAADGNLYTGISIPAGCATVTADGYPVGSITITALNRNVLLPPGGVSPNPVNSSDASVLISMLVPVTQPYKANADLDCNGATTAADASIIIQHLVAANPPFGPSNVCPPDGLQPGNALAGYAW